MTERKTKGDLEQMAEEIFELSKLASAIRAQNRAGTPEVLSETEFLTLDVLIQEGPMTVGAIQRRIGVLPAQMSRIIRSLENKGGSAFGGFVECTIHPSDRRKIDVQVTPKGRNRHRAYRSARLKMTTEILQDLTPEDRRQFIRICGRIRSGMAKRAHRE